MTAFLHKITEKWWLTVGRQAIVVLLSMHSADISFLKCNYTFNYFFNGYVMNNVSIQVRFCNSDFCSSVLISRNVSSFTTSECSVQNWSLKFIYLFISHSKLHIMHPFEVISHLCCSLPGTVCPQVTQCCEKENCLIFSISANFSD